jgi:peptidoglycan/LPS O-acetylase OafA/YrhL
MRARLLFIDIFRIAGISLVIFEHLFVTKFYPWLDPYYLRIDIFNQMYYITYASIGIWLFVVASGFSLAVSHPNVDSIGRLETFFSERFWRIYPAYWAAIILAIAIHQQILSQQFTALDYIKIVSGFESFGAQTWSDYFGKINNNFWFITLIVSLYLLFPIILFSIKKHPHLSLVSLLVISVASRYYMSHGAPFVAGTSWLALCSVFAFGLGIYMAQMGFYPKRITNNRIIVYLSNLSFYVYLVNGPILDESYYPAIFVISLLAIGSMLYMFDEAIKRLVDATRDKLNISLV